jgi:hypothetical protein
VNIFQETIMVITDAQLAQLQQLTAQLATDQAADDAADAAVAAAQTAATNAANALTNAQATDASANTAVVADIQALQAFVTSLYSPPAAPATGS